MVNTNKGISLVYRRDAQIKGIIPMVLALVVIACAGPKGTETEKLDYYANLEKETLAQLAEQSPESSKELEESVGHAIIEQKVVKVPIVGAGVGSGVVVEKATGKRSYLRVSRLDLGAGYGAKSLKLVMIFQDIDALRNLADGKFGAGAGAEAAAKAGEVGGAAEGSSGQLKKGYSLYALTDAGVSATATIRAFAARPYTPD